VKLRAGWFGRCDEPTLIDSNKSGSKKWQATPEPWDQREADQGGCDEVQCDFTAVID
jgi:hypothetical protein